MSCDRSINVYDGSLDPGFLPELTGMLAAAGDPGVPDVADFDNEEDDQS
jgi:hypothetical protein